MVRRLKAYRTANNSEVAEPSVQEFFKRNKITYHEDDCTRDKEKVIDAFKIYIERVRNISLKPEYSMKNHSTIWTLTSKGKKTSSITLKLRFKMVKNLKTKLLTGNFTL